MNSLTYYLNGRTVTIPADEPVFLLRAQDKLAADTVRYWADLARVSGQVEQRMVEEARAKADLMDAWPTQKFPDLPPPYVPRPFGDKGVMTEADEHLAGVGPVAAEVSLPDDVSTDLASPTRPDVT